mgnify:CR=1 FL=1
MLYTAIGLIVCLTPFVLVRLYKSKVKGFLTIFTVLAAVHLLAALITQTLHVFTYNVLLCVHAVVALYSIYLFITSPKSSESEPKNEGLYKRILRKWFLLIIISLGLFLLYSTRFNYSGVVDTAIGIKQVSNSSYTYPQYSDEWIGSSLVSYSIREKTLPLVNPLNNNEPFINFLLASHSLFGEIISIFNLNPLTQYVYLAILNGLLIALTVYIVLRLLLVRSAFAVLSALSTFLITNSGNLPSTWYILPYTASLTFFLFGIAGFLAKSRFAYLTNLIIALVLYPPIVIFVAPFLLAVSYGKKPDLDKIKFLALRVSIILIIAFGLLALAGSQSFSLGELYDRALSFVIRRSLDTGKVSYQFWNIIPVFLIPFICVGLFESFTSRKRFILFPAVIGTFFWIMYGFTRTVFLMEPSRIIVITSVLLILIAGIGMEKVYSKLNSIVNFDSEPFLLYTAKVCVCIFFFFWILFLPKLSLWHKLPMAVFLENTERLLVPAPPVTRYLTPEDLSLFSGYKEKRFISNPWKGLVIGVATQNFPLESKPSTLTNKILKYQNFMKGGCVYKAIVARKFDIDLVYSSPFSCPNHFFLKGTSPEGFNLYEFIDTNKK